MENDSQQIPYHYMPYTYLCSITAFEMHKIYDSGVMQHFPSTCTHIACKARAHSSEQGVRNDVREPQSQLLHFVLPSDGLCQLWYELPYSLSLAGFQDLAEPQLLLNVKNMKTLFRS